MTDTDLILLAASDLVAAGETELQLDDLVVAAWSLDRKRFGLGKYADRYPDPRPVEDAITEAAGLIRWGRSPVVELTDAGRERVKTLRGTR